MFIALLGGVLSATRSGRYLGVDQLLVPRLLRLREKHERLGKILLAMT